MNFAKAHYHDHPNAVREDGYSFPRQWHYQPSYLRDFREGRGWTQLQLAQWLGVRSNTVARWERQEKALPPLLALVMALEENLEESA